MIKITNQIERNSTDDMDVLIDILHEQRMEYIKEMQELRNKYQPILSNLMKMIQNG